MARRVSVSASPYWWSVTVTGNGKPVTAHLSNGKGGVRGVPRFVIRAFRDVSNTRQFPFTHLVIDELADILTGIEISTGMGLRTDWASVETRLNHCLTVARWGRHSYNDTACTNANCHG